MMNPHGYIPLSVDRIWSIWGLYYNIPKAMFYLLKGAYNLLTMSKADMEPQQRGQHAKETRRWAVKMGTYEGGLYRFHVSYSLNS